MAPSTSKNGKNSVLFKWEAENRGLDHKCGTCHTVLSSPRAKKSCIGPHEVPCVNYHRTLFFKDQQHNCDACRNMRELNLKRIREIALIAKGITTAEAAAASERASQKSLQRKRSASFLTARSDSDGAPSSADDDDAASLASEATSSPDAAPKRARVGLSKKEKKAQKSAAKSTTRAPVLSPADIKRVADLLAAIEPSLPPSPADESPAPGARPRIKSSTPPPSSEETYSQPIAAMVADLGISAAGKNAVNAKAVAPLRVAIAGHLEVRRNEREEKAMRMGGFVRYVGKRTLEVLEANNLLVDPETGERIKGKKGKWGEGEGDGGDDAEEEGVEEEGEEVEEGEEEGVEEGAEAAFVGVRDERR